MIDARPVLVAGGGPTGLTAAVELSRMGVPVRVVDRSPEPATTTGALALHARTLELLDARGLATALVAAGNPVRTSNLYAHGTRLATIDLRRIASRYSYVLLIPQALTERLLTTQLAAQGVRVERGTELTGVTQTGSLQVELRHPDGRAEQVRPSYLIDAEGPDGRVRQALGLRYAGPVHPERYALAELRIDTAPPDQIAVHLGDGGFVALFPFGAHRFRVLATRPEFVRPEFVPSAYGDAPDLARLQDAYDRVAHHPARFTELAWSEWLRIDIRRLDRLREGAVFFGGDAAHLHSPVGGQGLNAGLQDMINLAWKMALVLRGRARPELLDTYQDERLPAAADVRRATDLVTGAWPALRELAALGLNFAAAQDRGVGALGELSVHYPDSPLAGSGFGPLRAGDRVPDLTLADGELLYRRLDLDRPTLLLVEPDGSAEIPDETDWQRWRAALTVRRVHIGAHQPIPADQPVAAELRKAGALLLIRPDGYLGAGAPLTEPAEVLAWLDRWLVTG